MGTSLFVTGDGSHSLNNPDVSENYHSRHGAWSESMYVFLQSGFYALPEEKKDIRVFEMGLGTFLNAFQTLTESYKTGRTVDYVGIELYPVEKEIYEQLNYPDFSSLPEAKSLFLNMHQLPWGEKAKIAPWFSFTKYRLGLGDFHPEGKFDLVYFDAFSPDKQPDLWDAGVFDKMFAMMNPGGILVTYCAKGYVRRHMLASGFLVEKLPGPPGKREMLRARKPQ